MDSLRELNLTCGARLSGGVDLSVFFNVPSNIDSLSTGVERGWVGWKGLFDRVSELVTRFVASNFSFFLL